MGKVVASQPGTSVGGTAPAVKAAAAPAPALMAAGAGTKAQSGGMFATFGALLKEALVPLGLLAAQQTYGKKYSRKHRSSSSYTRKNRR
jgi:hypothetical protein